jgi:hypothetical protein
MAMTGFTLPARAASASSTAPSARPRPDTGSSVGGARGCPSTGQIGRADRGYQGVAIDTGKQGQGVGEPMLRFFVPQLGGGVQNGRNSSTLGRLAQEGRSVADLTVTGVRRELQEARYAAGRDHRSDSHIGTGCVDAPTLAEIQQRRG